MQTDATLVCNSSQHCWMLHVASVCTPCCMLLRVVAQSLKPVKLFSQQLPTLPTMLGPRTLITHGLQRLMGCILPTMYCRSQHCWELLHPFARSLSEQGWIAAFACPTTLSPGRFSFALEVGPPPKPWKSALGSRLHVPAKRRTTVGMAPCALWRNVRHHVTWSQETVNTRTTSPVFWSLNDIFLLVLHKPVG